MTDCEILGLDFLELLKKEKTVTIPCIHTVLLKREKEVFKNYARSRQICNCLIESKPGG